MIYGIGTDLVSIERFLPWILQPALMHRFFDDEELAGCKGTPDTMAASLAARFAAKEAFGKALGTGMRGLSLRDICVSQNNVGKPSLRLVGTAEQALKRSTGNKAGQKTRVHLSLSHDRGCALAFVVVETLDKE